MSGTRARRKEPQWYRDGIFYSLRLRSFFDANGDGVGDFPGLTEKLDYLQDLGVTTLWLLPFYPSPLRDDGYDISNYVDVHPEVGTLADFKSFLKEAHRRDLRVVTELVLNHTSDQHPWFARARRAPAGSPEREFYVWSDTATRYNEARIIFKDFERSNWTWDPLAKAYYWHRFYSHQPDLNFANPAVKKALLKVVDFWLELGVDGLRLDAVPYLFEEEGTNCENLPETFAFLEELRAHVDRKFDDRMLLAEANQWPEDAVRYLEGGNKCHMAFHFPIMPRMFMALHMEDRFPITEILDQTPPLPDSCQWALFLRNHDELTLEMVTEEERDYMYEAYGKDPIERINLGIRRRLAPLLNNNRRKIELLNTLLFSLPGTPILYYGDEIGMGDNVHLGDRDGVRTPMQWSADRNAGFSRVNPQRLYLPVIVDPEYHFESVNVEVQQANPSSLWWWTKRMIAVRGRYRVFGRGSCEFLDPGNPKVLAFLRELDDERILVVANLSRFTQHVELELGRFEGMIPVEVFGGTRFPALDHKPFVLTPGPHMVVWFALEPAHAHHDVVALTRAAIPELGKISALRQCTAAKVRSMLEGALVGFLPACGWFSERAQTAIKEVSVTDIVSVAAGEETSGLVFATVTFKEGARETYVVPLAIYDKLEAENLIAHDPASVVATLASSGTLGPTVLADALRSTSFCRALLRTVSRGRATRGAAAELKPGLTAWLRRSIELPSTELQPRMIGARQSHTRVVFGDRLILKVHHRSISGRHPDLEISHFLTERGFPNTPKLVAWLDYRADRSDAMTIGTLYEYVGQARGGWEYTREELMRYFERTIAHDRNFAPTVAGTSGSEWHHGDSAAVHDVVMGTYPASAELLGRRLGELHLVLLDAGDDDRFQPEAYGTLYQRSVYQSMRNLTHQVSRELKRSLSAMPAELQEGATQLIRGTPQLLLGFDAFHRRPIRALRIRHHGNFHLGRVLYTGKDFLIFDFDGEPGRSVAERLRKRSPIRDVAGMLRSFHYASRSAVLQQVDTGGCNPSDRGRLDHWAQHWYADTCTAFVRGYLKAATGAGFLPEEMEDFRLLLSTFVLERALSDLNYDLQHRPKRLPISVAGVCALLAGEQVPDIS